MCCRRIASKHEWHHGPCRDRGSCICRSASRKTILRRRYLGRTPNDCGGASSVARSRPLDPDDPRAGRSSCSADDPARLSRSAANAEARERAPAVMPARLKLTLAYDGTPFAGWQSQTHGNTIQDQLEKAIPGRGWKRCACAWRRSHRCRRACARPMCAHRFAGSRALA